MRKKYILPVLLLVIAVVLSACGSQESMTEEEIPTIVIGVDHYKPYSYIDDNGKYTGVDVEIAKETFARMGYKPEFRQITWEKKNDYLASGEIDCVWSCITMTEREDMYTWAGPYLNSYQVVAVRADSGIHTLQDLEDKRFAVQVSSKPDEILLSHENPQIPEVREVYSFATLDEMCACLRKGYCDAIAGHRSALQLFVDTMPDDFYILDESIYHSQLGVAFQKGIHEELAEELTEVLNQMQEDGSMASILKKYGMEADLIWSETDAE